LKNLVTDKQKFYLNAGNDFKGALDDFNQALNDIELKISIGKFLHPWYHLLIVLDTNAALKQTKSVAEETKALVEERNIKLDVLHKTVVTGILLPAMKLTDKIQPERSFWIGLHLPRA
jgi:hypothetical protein